MRHIGFRTIELGILLSVIVGMTACYGFVGAPPPDPLDTNQPPSTSPLPIPRTTPDPRTNPDPRPNPRPNPQPNPDPPVLACTLPAPTQLRRLTREEYKYAIYDLFGKNIDVTQRFPPDDNTIGFAVGEGVSLFLSKTYLKVAEEITPALDLNKLLSGCTTQKPTDACVKAMLATLGQQMYRRPLSGAEQTKLLQIYTVGKDKKGASNGMQMAIETLLQSPFFLYRIELGQAPQSGKVKLTGYEIASRLSFTIWKSIPDATLLDAARTGKLNTQAEIQAQVKRMMLDEKAKRTIHSFFEQWLELERLDTISKHPQYYPTFNKELAKDMRAETMRFIDHVVWEGDGSYKTLLTAPYSFINKRLADHYKVTGVQGSALVRKDFPASQKRTGILTHASILSIHALTRQSSPIHRGLFVRKHLLCHTPQPPPDNLMLKPPEVDENLPTRERFEAHRSDPNCKGCHQLMDPLGFAFEYFDGIGRFRAKDGKRDVDATGHFYFTDDIDGPYNGPLDMAKKLASSTQAQSCFVRQWFRYTYGREDTDKDACLIQSATKAFRDANYDIKAVIGALVAHPMFQHLKGDFTAPASGSNASPLKQGAPKAATPPLQRASCSTAGHRGTPLSGWWMLFGLCFFGLIRRKGSVT